VQAELGRGTYVARGPRLPLHARELENVKGILAQALKVRPAVRRWRFVFTARVLLVVLAALAAVYAWRWFRMERDGSRPAPAKPGVLHLAIGFVTSFFDTLGIGSFAPTTAVFKFRRVVADEATPDTLTVGHTLPTAGCVSFATANTIYERRSV
jgi:hypothetical protein